MNEKMYHLLLGFKKAYPFATFQSRTLSSRLLSKNVKTRIHRTITLLWFCDIKGKTKTEGVCDSVLREIFGPKRDVMGEWRKLRNEKLHDLYFSSV
jgi:hypothetical protein